MISGLADESEIAAVGILAAETVTAAAERDRIRRTRLTAGRRDGLVQGIDGFAVGNVEHEADHRRLHTDMQAEEMVIAGRTAKKARGVSRLDRLKHPCVFIKARGLLDIGGGKLDAAHAANETRRHFDFFPIPTSSN